MIVRVGPIALVLGLLAGFVSAETVQRRGGGEPITAVEIEVRPEGLYVVRANGTPQIVPWDMVQSIEEIQDPVALKAWELKQPMAEDLWRARTRLQRGDGRLAEPLFEAYFENLRSDGADSELSLIVAEGLLRSRLSAGEIEAAIPSALETIRLRRAGVTTDRYLGLPEVLDERIWLVPTLPPVPTDRAALLALPESLAPWIQDEDKYIAALARAYSSMSRESKVAEVKSGNSGVQVVQTAIDTLADDAKVRTAAIRTLNSLAEQPDAPDFVSAWKHWFNARSMMLEEDVDLDIALIELLHIPAIYRRDQPALAARAVACAADTLQTAGRDAEAALLQRELFVSQADVRPALALETEQPTTQQYESESDEDDLSENQ